MNANTDILALRLHAALDALRAGKPVIVADDHDRENEADLILAADVLTVPEMARLIRDCSGIVCLCLTPEHAARLALPPMVADNGSRYGTAFTVSIEAAEGVSTGVSAVGMQSHSGCISVMKLTYTTLPGANVESTAAAASARDFWNVASSTGSTSPPEGHTLVHRPQNQHSFWS